MLNSVFYFCTLWEMMNRSHMLLNTHDFFLSKFSALHNVANISLDRTQQTKQHEKSMKFFNPASSGFNALLLLIFVSAAALVVIISPSFISAARGPAIQPVEIRSEDKLLELTQSENTVALVYFYAGWCATCKRFTKEEYSKIAQHFGQPGYHGHVAVTKMDGHNFPKLTKSLNVQGFPAIFLYSIDEIGVAEQYAGELTGDSLQAWVEERLHKRMTDKGHMIPPKKKKRGII